MCACQWKANIISTTVSLQPYFYNLPYKGTNTLRHSWHTYTYWAVQVGLLTPLTFAWHRLSPLAAFTSGAYFLHNGRRWQWICKFYTANFKDILEACSQSVSGNKQELVACAIGCPKMHFFHELTIFWLAKKRCKDTFFPPSIPFPWYFLQLQQWWHLYCFAVLGSTSIVIHSMKQHLLRNWPGSDAATSHDFLRERLRRAFTHANQLHWTAQ